MDEDPFERMRQQMERAREEVALEMRRVREEVRAAMDEARAEIERARAEVEAHVEAARAEMRRAMEERDLKMGGFRDGSRRGWFGPRTWKGRPRRKPPGGEPAPVSPKPKPTPLTDGAEAPLD